VSENDDRRERELARLLDAAAAESRPALSDEDAEQILARVQARVRAAAAPEGWSWTAWPVGLGLAATVLAAVLVPQGIPGPPPRPTAAPHERVARETVLRLEVDGRTVFIRAVAYE
jgi:hypothetical protein